MTPPWLRMLAARLRARVPADLTPSRAARGAGVVLFGLATLAFTAYVFAIFNDAMRHKSSGGDEGYFIWCGWCINKGLAPYRDFIEFKPPVFFLTHALAQKLYGVDGLQFRRFFAYFPLASVLALQIALWTRRVDKLLSAGLVVGLVYVWVNTKFHDTALSDSESVGLSYFFFGVAFLLLGGGRWRAWTTAIGAALLFCCVQSKEPFLPVVGCTWLGCFLLAERRLGWKADLRAYVKHSAIGVGLVLAALLVYMTPTGSLRAYVTMVRRYTVVYRDAKQSFCVLGGVFTPTTPMNDFFRAWYRARAEYINTATFGFFVPYAAGALFYTWRRSKLLFATSLAACAAGFLAVSASNCPWQHYYNMFLSGLVFFLAAGLVAMTPYMRSADPATRMLIRIAVLANLALATGPRLESERVGYGTHVVLPPPPGAGAGSTLETVLAHTVPGDRIVTTGNPILYVQANRLSAIRESNLLDPILPFYEGDTDVEKLSSLRNEMVRNRPKLVILDPEFAATKVRHRDALFMPFLNEFHYRKLTDTIYERPE